jgi:hypothetical protein
MVEPATAALWADTAGAAVANPCPSRSASRAMPRVATANSVFASRVPAKSALYRATMKRFFAPWAARARAASAFRVARAASPRSVAITMRAAFWKEGTTCASRIANRMLSAPRSITSASIRADWVGVCPAFLRVQGCYRTEAPAIPVVAPLVRGTASPGGFAPRRAILRELATVRTAAPVIAPTHFLPPSESVYRLAPATPIVGKTKAKPVRTTRPVTACVVRVKAVRHPTCTWTLTEACRTELLDGSSDQTSRSEPIVADAFPRQLRMSRK